MAQVDAVRFHHIVHRKLLASLHWASNMCPLAAGYCSLYYQYIDLPLFSLPFCPINFLLLLFFIDQSRCMLTFPPFKRPGQPKLFERTTKSMCVFLRRKIAFSLPNKSATLKPPNYLGPDSLICFEAYSLKTLVYWRMNLPCSFAPKMWRSNNSQVLKPEYVLFLMPEGWLIVWVILTFLPEWRSWRDHEFSVWSARCWLTYQAHWPHKGLLLYWGWGVEPSLQASAPWGACACARTQLYIKPMLYHSDSLHALQGCNGGSPDTSDRVLTQKRLAWSWLGHVTPLKEQGPSTLPPGSAGGN